MTRRHFLPALGITLSWPLAGRIPPLVSHQEPSIMKKLLAAWQAENDARVGRLLERQELLQTFLLRAGEALSLGGIHTPNHRWVVCMALARLYHLFPNKKYLKRIDEWLREKIDIDPDGQYSEKSTHIYSPLTNRCLITVARLLDRPYLYEPVRRNLDMTLYYLHPNGEIVTEASGRQDQYSIAYPTTYYYTYRYLALRDGNPQFVTMVHQIEATTSDTRLSQLLAYFLEDPSLANPLPYAEPLPDDYRRSFPYSQLVRIRRREVDTTVLAENSSFFTFSNGAAVLQAVRLASAFFGKGQFVADAIQSMDGAVVLRQELEGPYYQLFPYEELPDDGDWEKMPREKRPTSEMQFLRSIVKVSEVERGFTLHFDIGGTDDVPLTIELAFRTGGDLTGVEEVPGIPMAYYLKEGQGRYRFDDNTIEFGPGLHNHGWTQIRGAETKMKAMSVYLTGFTPFQFRLFVKKGK